MPLQSNWRADGGTEPKKEMQRVDKEETHGRNYGAERPLDR